MYNMYNLFTGQALSRPPHRKILLHHGVNGAFSELKYQKNYDCSCVISSLKI